MIRIKVELVPFGNEEEAREIAQMVIANDGTALGDTGNYGFAYSSDRHDEGDGVVKNFGRDEGIWKLISKCLENPEGMTPEDEDFIDILWDRMNGD